MVGTKLMENNTFTNTKYMLLGIVMLFIVSPSLWGAIEVIPNIKESPLWGKNLIGDIFTYGTSDSLKLGYYFTLLQSVYFKPLFLGVLVGVPVVFFVHYLVIGAKEFSHDGKKVYVFTLFNRIIHAIAAISFTLLLPTGLIMIFGSVFGGGGFVFACKEIHAISTLLFVIAVFPMFVMWVKRMFFTIDDWRWLKILGGYLSKEKKPIPAGKFNAGQKAWFWIVTLGGVMMIWTGGIMYFQEFDLKILTSISQIDLLRLSSIVHSALGIVILGLFITHLYMTLFVIKGTVQNMIDGYKSEEEIENLHSSYHKELKESGDL